MLWVINICLVSGKNVNNNYLYFQNIDAICTECHQELTKVPALYQGLQEKVPPGEFYRYHHNFRGTTHRLVAATCLITYLEENR